MTLWTARHAPVLANGLCYGRYDPPVTLAHTDAAELLRLSLPTKHPSSVLSSPTPRCAEVAAHLAQLLSVEHVVDARLCELDFGSWEGRRWDDIEREPEFGPWARRWREARTPEGESTEELTSRIREVAEERLWGVEDVAHELLVAHAGVVRALRVLLEGVTWDEAMAEPVPHLEWQQRKPALGSPLHDGDR